MEQIVMGKKSKSKFERKQLKRLNTLIDLLELAADEIYPNAMTQTRVNAIEDALSNAGVVWGKYLVRRASHMRDVENEHYKTLESNSEYAGAFKPLPDPLPANPSPYVYEKLVDITNINDDHFPEPVQSIASGTGITDTRQYAVGPQTMRRVFIPNNMQHLADLQAFLDAVESALSGAEPNQEFSPAKGVNEALKRLRSMTGEYPSIELMSRDRLHDMVAGLLYAHTHLSKWVAQQEAKQEDH
jgi:hypothetical protein